MANHDSGASAPAAPETSARSPNAPNAPNAKDGGSFLQRLRASTGAAHEALDASLPLGADEVTRERYGAFLRGSLLVVEPLEQALGALGYPLDGPSRSAAIRADLAALGVAPADESATLPLPAVDDEARALGVSYVMEGSSLGGLYLARAVGGPLGLEPGADGLRYLSLRGAGTKAAWNAFTARLEDWAARASLPEQDRACEAAERTFGAYVAAFAATGASRSAGSR